MAGCQLTRVPRSESRSTPSAPLVRTTTSNLIAVRRLLLDPEVCAHRPGAMLPPAPQTSHDVDALAAAQRDRYRTRWVTFDSPSAVMRTAGDRAEGVRLRALIVILWRAGLRISEALALAEGDLDPVRGAVLVRAGKGGRRREVGMDRWGWEQLRAWLETRTSLPVGAWPCVLHGPTAGRPWTASSAREELRAAAVHAGVRRRFAPHQGGELQASARLAPWYLPGSESARASRRASSRSRAPADPSAGAVRY
jgi:integrase